MKSVETVATITRIRQLIKTYGVNRTAKMVGRTHSSISHIKSGRRHARTGAAIINDLELKKVRGGKLCRCCGDKQILFTKSGRCVVCELLELAKADVVIIVLEG